MKHIAIILIVCIISCAENAGNTPPITTVNLKAGVDTACVEQPERIKKLAKPETDKKFWQQFEVDAAISKNSIFKSLDSLKDPWNIFDDTTKNNLRTISLHHYITSCETYENQFFKNTIEVGDISRCNAYIDKKGHKLLLRIGYSPGFSGWGFDINIDGDKFISIPYYFDDVIWGYETDAVNYPLTQKLILNRPSFSLNDSIYGHISFKSVFFNEYSFPSKHDVKGYFRAKVEEKYW